LSYKRVSPIPVNEGGSGAKTFTIHGVLLGNTTSAFGVTAAGTTGQVLTGSTGADPIWASPAASSISITGNSGGALTGASFTFTGGTTGITFSGSGSTETLTGTLVVANGGTGNTTFTAYAPIIAGTTATGAFQSASTGLATSGFVLTSNGSASVPSFQAPSASSISITGDSGGALTGASFTFTGGTTGLTFSGSGSTETLTGTLVVANGGSGRATATAYAVICGGTTSTAAHQSIASVGTSGQVLTSNGAGALPTFQTASSGGTSWSVITADQTAVINNGYICNKASTLVLTLPTTAVVGSVIEVTGINTALGWQIAQGSGQQIFFGNVSTTSGATGTLTSSAIRDSIKIVCVVADTTWNVLSSIGNITYV
jgi:hypothetical protein